MKTCEIESVEAERYKLQSDLDDQKSPLDRNKLGQFHTPTQLARDILAYGLNLLNSNKIRFIDPAFGTGTFFSALQAHLGPQTLEKAVGFEIDPHYARPTVEFWRNEQIKIVEADFIKQVPSQEYNLLICNPPYVRHHHLSEKRKKELKDKLRAGGYKISGLAGLYCYFLLLSHEWLEEGGVAGWLIPSEFMTVNYGAAIRNYLTKDVTLLHIHRFNPEDAQFSDAIVSSAVVWFKKEKPRSDHKARFTYGGSLLDPVIEAKIPISVLAHEPKWTRFPQQSSRTVSQELTLGDLFKIKRGIATGCNEFFILPEYKIAELDLPLEVFKPILPSPRHLDSNRVLARQDGSPDLEKRLFLLDITFSKSEIALRYPSLFQYIESGESQGLHKKYLNRSRKPWYSQEKRPAAPLVCTYMGRSSRDTELPVRFILNESASLVTNVFLAMYPTPAFAKLIKADPALLETVWRELNELPVGSILDESRVYGGGLHKVEPKELAKVKLHQTSIDVQKMIKPTQLAFKEIAAE